MAKNKPTVVKSLQALWDIVEIADYVAQRTGLTAVDRFVNAAERTIERLGRMPGIGDRWDDNDPELADVRVSPISRYRNHLVLYRPIEGDRGAACPSRSARSHTHPARG